MSMGISNALIFLSKQFACGVDIKFEVPTATVLVLQEELGQYHQIRQMFGRGMRDHLTGSGVLYTKKPADTAKTIAIEIMNQESNPFQEGPDVLLQMKKQAKNPSTNKGTRLANGANFDWITTLSAYKLVK